MVQPPNWIVTYNAHHTPLKNNDILKQLSCGIFYISNYLFKSGLLEIHRVDCWQNLPEKQMLLSTLSSDLDIIHITVLFHVKR